MQNVLAHVGTVPVERYHAETEQRNDVRQVGGRDAQRRNAVVDNQRLQGWEHRASQNGHDMASTRYLHIAGDATQRQAVDGGEHQRHAG